MVKTIIALGRELDMRVTVEGVETTQQAAFLDRVDADQVQGFFFGRPLSGAEIGVELLKHLQKRLSAQSPSSQDEADHSSSQRLTRPVG